MDHVITVVPENNEKGTRFFLRFLERNCPSGKDATLAHGLSVRHKGIKISLDVIIEDLLRWVNKCLSDFRGGKHPAS